MKKPTAYQTAWVIFAICLLLVIIQGTGLVLGWGAP